MPPTTQRRNTAYLNRLKSRIGQVDRGFEATPELPTWTNRLLHLRRLIEGRRPSHSLFLICAF
jgi:hypothetical protein